MYLYWNRVLTSDGQAVDARQLVLLANQVVTYEVNELMFVVWYCNYYFMYREWVTDTQLPTNNSSL